jgi:hypothetical protein
MNKIQGVMYDESGQRTFTDNVDVLTMQIKDKLLLTLYRNTRYQKALFLEVDRLNKMGVEFKLENAENEPELIENSLVSMISEISNRFGDNYVESLEDKIINEDLAFLKNRPEELK